MTTAAEFLKQLHSDPEWLREYEEDERKRAEEEARLLEDEQPIVEDLREAGFAVDSVWDLVKQTGYPEAIPILVQHLKKPYASPNREGIARALGEVEAKKYLPEIFDAFEWDPDTRVNGPKWALGNTIEILADQSHLHRVLELATDTRHGEARSELVQLLGRWKRKSEIAKAALDQLSNDKDPTVRATARAARDR